MPFGGGSSQSSAPTSTGSISAPVTIQQPLPPTLAYSDATKIGEAAATAMSQVDGAPSGEWINNATGSSGTVVQSAPLALTEEPEQSRGCSVFNTIVTSIRGVHQYSGRVCDGANGRPVVEIGSPGQTSGG